MKQKIPVTKFLANKILLVLFFINSGLALYGDETADDLKAVSSVLHEILEDPSYKYIDKLQDDAATPLSFDFLEKIAKFLSVPAVVTIIIVLIIAIFLFLFFLIKKISIGKKSQSMIDYKSIKKDEPERLLAESIKLLNEDKLKSGVLFSMKALICYYGKINLIILKNGTTFREYCSQLESKDEKEFFKKIIHSVERIVFSACLPDKMESISIYEKIRERIRQR